MKVNNRSLFLGKEIWKNKQIYAMLIPSVLLLSVIVIYPISWVLRYAFYDYDRVTEPIFIGLDNFVRAFTRDALFWNSVKNTFIYVVSKLLITLPLSFTAALILNRKFRGSRSLQMMIFSPTIMSGAIMAMIFYMLLNPYNGQINMILSKLHLIDAPVNWLGDFAMLCVILIGVWGAIGNYMIYFMAGLQSVPNEIYECAELDGVNTWQRLWSITLPMMMPVLKVILLISITNSFQDMQTMMVLTEGGPNGATEVMQLYIYKLFFPISAASGDRAPVQFGYGSALSIISALIIGCVTLIYFKATKKMDSDF